MKTVQLMLFVAAAFLMAFIPTSSARADGFVIINTPPAPFTDNNVTGSLVLLEAVAGFG